MPAKRILDSGRKALQAYPPRLRLRASGDLPRPLDRRRRPSIMRSATDLCAGVGAEHSTNLVRRPRSSAWHAYRSECAKSIPASNHEAKGVEHMHLGKCSAKPFLKYEDGATMACENMRRPRERLPHQVPHECAAAHVSTPPSLHSMGSCNTRTHVAVAHAPLLGARCYLEPLRAPQGANPHGGGVMCHCAGAKSASHPTRQSIQNWSP